MDLRERREKWRDKWKRFQSLPVSKKIVVLKQRAGILVRTPDRMLLEGEIFRWIRSREGMRNILFIGVDQYTKHYASFFPDATFHTIDNDPSRARFGSDHHLIASIADVTKQFPPRCMDVVIMNGVYGWGLDEQDEAEEGFQRCYDVLRPGGLLVLGWNNIPERNPLDIDTISSLRRFTELGCPLFKGNWRYEVPETENRHTYDFYTKP
jgi:SAM-dependent methyltransferase